MKLRVVFKTPNAVDYALSNIPLDENDDEASIETRLQFRKLTDKFVQYGELIIVDFDTDTGTATVIPIK